MKRLVFLVLFAMTSSACAEPLSRAGDDGVSLGRVAFALLICIALAVAAAFLMRARLGTGFTVDFLRQDSRRLKLIETLRFGRLVSLSIVECDGQQLLLMTSDTRAELITRLPFNERDKAS